jgi:hypothetical protein
MLAASARAEHVGKLVSVVAENVAVERFSKSVQTSRFNGRSGRI